MDTEGRCGDGLPIVTVPGVHRFVPTDRPAERIARCMAGLAMFGLGIALLIDANLGAAPWDVFHTGVSELTGIPVGTVIIITGVLLLLLWIPLGESPGLGTILNVFAIGLFVDIFLPLLPEPEMLVPRVVMMLAGVVVIGAGSGLYIGAGLGPGPRDGLMTGLGRRGVSIRVARTGIELLVMLAGVALGGSIGIGTAVFALGIGPMVHIFLPRLSIRERPAGSTDRATPSTPPRPPKCEPHTVRNQLSSGSPFNLLVGRQDHACEGPRACRTTSTIAPRGLSVGRFAAYHPRYSSSQPTAAARKSRSFVASLQLRPEVEATAVRL